MMVRFRDTMRREEMLKAIINPQTLEIICPSCNKSNFTIFRRDKTPPLKESGGSIPVDKVSQKVYLNHCKCENCGQLFTYNVDKKNNPILEEDKNGI